jgi:hypothetical protein
MGVDERKTMMNQNAIIGMAVERLFKNTIGHQQAVLDTLKRHFGIQGDFGRAYSTGTDAGKSDVIVRFTDATLSANIKAYQAGFNQLTRVTIAAFCREFDIANLQGIFEAGAVRVAGRFGRFILEQDEDRIIAALAPLARRIVHFSLSRLENPELLVLYNRTTNTMHLYDMQEVLNNLNYDVTISARGVIKIGTLITIQRKGGNGVHSLHIEKTALNHPGNNLQVKMKVKEFVLTTAVLVTYCP